jgi:type II secretory pathway pseudopilin PulG
MKKSVSPAFAAIVILIVLIVGALYFMTRYRADQIQWRQEQVAAQAQAARAKEMLRASGRQPGQRGRARGGGPGAEAARSTQPGRGAGTEAAPTTQPGRNGSQAAPTPGK